MGKTIHDTLIVTFQDEEFPKLKEFISDFATERMFLFGPLVVNSYRTMVMVPDGSNEGWGNSQNFDIIRGKVKHWIEKNMKTAEIVHVRHGEIGPQIV